MKIAVVVGARPQFIKAATVSRCIRSRSDITEVLIHTGQHYDSNMSDVFFSELDIPPPDHHLAIGGGTHGQNTGRMIEAIERVLTRESADRVLVYGDTDSTLAGAIAAVKLNIPLAHVEAGLRSFNRRMPEEINRVLTDHAADLLFAPTEAAVSNLAAEGLGGEKVRLVGDVMYDATLHYTPRARRPRSVTLAESGPFALCTIHRAENTNDHSRLAAIVRALNCMAEQIPLILPLHPRTRSALERLANVELSGAVQVVEPVGFLEMTWLLNHCELVITDSGGVQKEAYFHRKPCLTLRDETEWVELVDAGYNRLVSPNASDLLDAYEGMRAVAVSITPGLYGAGDAAERIVSILN
jgi:UDP-GlcNAc3NAcA epimerase